MSPRQLEYFLEIYKCGSIKKVAENRIISSQALSKTIKDIEEELGVVLFIRGKKHLEPTVEAEKLKNHAVRILEEYQNINRIKSMMEEERKKLTLYSVDGFLQYVSIEFIEDFQNQYPDITINIIETTEMDIEEKLKKRDIDLAIITKSLDQEIFRCVYLYSNLTCLVMHKEHPLVGKEKISLLDLNQQPIAGKGTAYSCYSSNLSRLFYRDINPKVLLETTNDALILKMAEHNLAIGITLDYIAFSGKGENCVIKPFEEEGQKRNVFWVENNYATLSYEEHCFRNFLFKWVDEHREHLFH